MSSKVRVFLASTLFSSVALVAFDSPGSGAAGLTYPSMNTDPQLSQFSADFPLCSLPDQEFCIEKLEFTPEGGEKRTVTNPVRPLMERSLGPDPSVNAFFQGEYKGPSVNTASGMPPMLTLNFFDINKAGIPGTTDPGLRPGLYTTSVRVGDYNPSFMMLTGKYESYSVVKGDDGYYTLTIGARPAIWAVVASNGADMTPITNCESLNWLAGCEATSASRSDISISFVIIPDATMRDALSGSWISTNASMFSFGTPNFLTGEINVTAKGPHFVPADFNVNTLKQEGDRYVNPAFFEMYMSFGAVAKMMGVVSGQSVTADQAKAFLAKPSEVLEGTIKEAASASAAAVDKAQSLKTTLEDKGVRIDFGIDHFSAPNPKLKVKAPAALTAPVTTTTTAAPTTTTVPAATTTIAPVATMVPAATTPARTGRTLSNGAKLSIATTATKGRTLTAKSLLSPSSGASVSRIQSRSTKVCTVKGTSVKMVKSGTCRLSATVKAKSKSSSLSFSITVA